MIIESIHIDSFGLFRDLDLAFDRGVNVIEGPNESGKSTLSAFILYLLYGFTSRSTAVDEREHRVNWESGEAGGSMIVSVCDGRYRVSRRTVKTEAGTYREEAAVTDLATGAPVGARAAAGETFLGVPESVFLDTAMTGQLRDPAVRGEGMREAMENILFSGGETVNTLRAVRTLEEAKYSLLHRGERGGVLYELGMRREALAARIAEADRSKDDLLEKEALLKDTIARKEDAFREEAKFTRLEGDYRNTMVIRSYDNLHEEEEKQKRVQDETAAYRRAHSFGDFFPGYEYLTDLAVARRARWDAHDAQGEAARRVTALENEANEITEAERRIPAVDAAGGEDAIRAVYQEHHHKGIRRIGGASALLAAAATLLLLGVALFLPRGLFLPVILCCGFGAIGGLVGGYLLPIGIRYYRGASELAATFHATGAASLDAALAAVTEARRQIGLRKERLRRAEQDRAAADEKYAECCRALSDLVEKWGRTLPAEGQEDMLDELVRDATGVITEQGRLQAQSASLDATIRELRRELGDRNEVSVRGTVAPTDREKLVNLNHKDLLAGIERCHQQVKYYEGKQAELEKMLAETHAREADPAVLAEQMNDLSRRIDELRRSHDAFALAMRTVAEAGANLRAEISPRLGAYAANLMREVTDGKYEMTCDGETMRVELEHDGVRHPVGAYSAGTQDVAYLALRMALVDLLYREAPPLLFDETLCRQDDDRARGILRVLGELAAEGRQCLLFTCLGRDAALARETLRFRRVKLAGGTAEISEE